MNCRTFHKHYVELLDIQPEGPRVAELTRHLESCPDCAAFYAAIRQTLPALKPSCTAEPEEPLKEKIMSRILELETAPEPVRLPSPRLVRLTRPLWAAASLVLMLAIASMLLRQTPPTPPGPGPVRAQNLSLIIQAAAAAEERNFTGPGTIHLVNEILVMATEQPELAQIRWLPMMVLESDGKSNLSRLNLPAAPGEGYTVTDEVWFEAASGRFKRLLTRDKQTLFATAFDGQAIYLWDPSSPGGVVRQPVASSFKPPLNPAALLGLGAGLPVSPTQLKEENLADTGQEKLGDGSLARVFKSVMPDPDGKPSASYWLFKIREQGQTIAEMDWYLGPARLLLIRRAKTEPAQEKEIAWNLKDIPPAPPRAPGAAPRPGVQLNSVVADTSVTSMAAHARYETYLFSPNPAWTAGRMITESVDPATPAERMFAITYRAADHRHVVLVHSPTYNKLLGPMAKMGKIVYQSPNGFKVLSGPRDAWLAQILLQSVQYATHEKPAAKISGYMLESPAGTFPALAVNGLLGEQELHALIDSLVPAKDYRGK